MRDQILYDEIVDAIDESDQLKRILTKIVKTSQEREKSLNSKLKLKKEYLRKVEEVCNKIFSELKEEKGLKGARKAGSLVDRIRKCYDELKRSS